MNKLTHLCRVALLALFSIASMHAQANPDVDQECLLKALENAPDSTTLAEIRSQCQTLVQDGSGIMTERMEQDRENVMEPFTILAHRPNYLLLAAYNDEGYGESIEDDLGIEQERFDDTEAQFQLSIKVPLAIDLFESNVDIYGAYTMRSFWQVYNDDESAPFRETNHEPELWLQTYPDRSLFGLNFSVFQFGLNHQSNGRSEPLSRSWNRVFANFIFEKDNFAFGFKPWYRISEDSDEDDNPDITDFLGHYELRAAYKTSNNHVFSLMSRNNLESGFDEGAVEAGWSFPLGSWPYLKGYVQYFYGYGESLIDYDEKTNRIGIGILLEDWL